MTAATPARKGQRTRQRILLAARKVFAEAGGQEKLVALLTATLMAIEGRDGVSD